MKKLLIVLSTLTLLYTPSFAADNNTDYTNYAQDCSTDANTNLTTSIRSNLNSLLNSLSTNVNLHYGFYKAAWGRDADRIYGLVQCRGDLSARDCANCTEWVIGRASQRCPNTVDVTIRSNWCYLRYSGVRFFGDWERSLSGFVDNSTEDRGSFSNRSSYRSVLVNGLVGSTPEQPLMFQTAVLDAGSSGRRYGMAQCNRDISRSNCGQCLGYLQESLGTFTNLADSIGWQLYGSSCRLWYNDYQFYFNYSIPTTAAGSRVLWQGGAVVGTTLLAMILHLLFL